MIIDCVSDLHGHCHKLEGGDLLIIAGDFVARENLKSYFDFFDWVQSQDYLKKVLVAGNHDSMFQDEEYKGPAGAVKDVFEYLCDSGCEFEGIKIWGSPWTKSFWQQNPRCKGFSLDSEEELAEKWGLIPNDTDILVTHSPPHGILDASLWDKEEFFGCRKLREEVLCRVKPKLHVFGHVHEWGGRSVDINTTKFVNASLVNELYEPVHGTIRINWATDIMGRKGSI